MRNIFETWLGKNPVDEEWQARLGLPDTMRELLATINPRPSGLLLRGLSIIDGKDIWTLTPEDWRREVARNSGTYIAFLLRHPASCPADFHAIFTALEGEYQALLRRADWVKGNLVGQPRAIMVTRLIEGLQSELLVLEATFVDWAAGHHAEIVAAIRRVLDLPDGGCNGNAEQDWSRARAAWGL